LAFVLGGLALGGSEIVEFLHRIADGSADGWGVAVVDPTARLHEDRKPVQKVDSGEDGGE
jgi:hypothetical protein